LQEDGGLPVPPPFQPAEIELASVTLGRRAFAVLLGMAFAVSAGLCVYATQSAEPLLDFRSAVQLSGWLCIAAVFVGFCARVPRNRRDLPEVTAAATGFFTGAAMLYLAYFQWSELPTAPAAPLAVKTTPGVWNPAEHLALPKAPVTVSAVSAAAGGTAARRAAPVVWPQAVAVAVDAVPTVTKDDGCAAETGLSRLFCEERARLARCAARNDADADCPSVIPASPPQ
jgi:hypothetical protein